jgi:sterol desaturase/sphingolipid hydroxylase (fatty acid hydroxylase superfamily)
MGMVGGAVETAWTQLVDAWPYSEHLLFMFAGGVPTALCYALWCILQYFIQKNAWLTQYKIAAPDKYPPDALINKALKQFVIDGLVLRWPVLWAVSYPLVYCGMTADPEALPALGQFLWQIFLCVVIDDTYFYWAHRAMHSKHLYKAFHKQHHEFREPIALGAEYCHPVEGIFVNLASTALGPALLGCHMAVTIFYFCLKVYQTMEVHSGYVVPFPFSVFSLTWPLDFGDNGRHAFHHSHNVGNYGGMINFWDRAMGTDRAFNAWKGKDDAEKAKAKAN